MKTITVKLPRPLGERLGRAVVRRRSTRSTVVREAIEAYLAAETGETEGSCFDLASDLAGSVRRAVRPVVEPSAAERLRSLRVVLADTGPVVAYLNGRDRHHAWAVGAFRQLRPPLFTCEAVLSEAVFLLQSAPGGGEKVMDLVKRGVLQVAFDLQSEVAAVSGLLRRYRSLPMDLADGCLVRMSELHADCVLLTVDSEFRDVYRRNGRQVIPTLLPPGGRRRR